MATKKSGHQIVVDGIELPYSGNPALAAALYHKKSGDRVIYRKKKPLVEVQTRSGNSISLTSEYANIVAGKQYEKWSEVTEKILGRSFDTSLDLACYRNKSVNEKAFLDKALREGQNPFDYFFSRRDFYTTERISVKHLGSCSFHSDTPHIHDLQIDIHVHGLFGSEHQASLNLDSFREELSSLSEKLIVSTGDTVGVDRLVDLWKACHGESSTLVIPSGSKWHETIARMVIVQLQMDVEWASGGTVELREDGSLLAMTELKGDE